MYMYLLIITDITYITLQMKLATCISLSGFRIT